MREKSATANDKVSIMISFSVLAIIVISLLIAIIVSIGIDNQKLSERELTLRAERDELISSLKLTSDNMNEKTAELADLQQRIDGIKTGDDLLKRDIFLYIDKKFQLIPKTVSKDIAEQIIKYSKLENVSPELIVGIIQVESAFNPMAISSKNARGLMQVMPEWAPKFKLKYVSDLHDIDTNIQCGIKVLKIHIKEGKGNISKGLYYYVGKSESYAGKVYEAMGKFVAFRSTINLNEGDVDIEEKGDGIVESISTDEGAK